MLQSIRDRSQGWLAGVIVSLVIATFILWGVHTYLTESGGQPDVAATVNGYKITQGMLNTAYERLRQQQQMQLGADFVLDQKTETQLKKQALSQLIVAQVLSQAAIKEGFRVTMGEIEGALLGIPAFQVNGRFSRERFNEVLSSTLYTEKSFLDDLQTSMLINQVRGGFIASAFALPQEIDTAIKLINQKRDIGYAIIPAARFVKDVTINEDEALAYYNQHHDLFTTPEQVGIEYIELSVAQLTSNLHFTDDELMQYYKNNLNNYTSPQRWHVAHILVQVPGNATLDQENVAKDKINGIARQLASGANFTELARKYSDDKLTAGKGGVLDWFSTGMIDPAIEKAASTLQQTGAVSQPVRTKYGFSIVKLLDVEKPQVKPFAEVRSQVSKAFAQQQAEQVFADNSEKLSNLTYANPGSLDVAAKTLGLQVKTSALFDKNGGKDDVTANPKIIAAAFSAVVLGGNNSDVIELNPDRLIVLRVKQHVPAALKPFESVRAQVVQQLKDKAAQQKAESLGQQLLAQLQQGAATQPLLQKNGLQWKVAKEVSRYSTQAPAAVVNLAFRTPRPADDAHPAANGLQLPNGDYAVVKIMAVHDGAINDPAGSQKRIYREELQNDRGQLDYALYVKQQLSGAKIVINDKDLEIPLNSLHQE